MQHFLTSESQKDWGPGIRGRLPDIRVSERPGPRCEKPDLRCREDRAQVLVGVKVRPLREE